MVKNIWGRFTSESLTHAETVKCPAGTLSVMLLTAKPVNPSNGYPALFGSAKTHAATALRNSPIIIVLILSPCYSIISMTVPPVTETCSGVEKSPAIVCGNRNTIPSLLQK
jgi:hypothetical protein